MKRIFLIPLIFISFVLFSCDAPRLNPLDPENPDNRVGQADGFVYSVSHQPINGVRVTLKYQKISAVSDSLGRYELNTINCKFIHYIFSTFCTFCLIMKRFNSSYLEQQKIRTARRKNIILYDGDDNRGN